MKNNVKRESLILMSTLLFIFVSQVIRDSLMYLININLQNDNFYYCIITNNKK